MKTSDGITEMVISFNELDNTNNLEDRKPSNNLFRYHMTAYEDSMYFEPYTPQYKKLKNGELVFLALKMMHRENNIITDGPVTSVVLCIKIERSSHD